MIEKFKKIFSGLQRAHGCTYIEKKNVDGTKLKGKSFVKREPVTDVLWENHLKGIEPSLGIIPINEENKCGWGCIDIDSYASFNHKKLLDKIKAMDLPLITCRSKSGGAHVFLFTTVPVNAEILRNKLLSISAVLGYGNSEIFPKQIKLNSKEDTGNFLNLPYFNSQKTTRYSYVENGAAATLDGFFESYERNKLTPEQLEKLTIKRTESELSDGPPCMEALAVEGISEGGSEDSKPKGRDNALFHYAVYAKKKWPSEWKNKIILFNEKVMNPPLDDASVERIKLQHVKKEWGYKCKDEPMCSYCDKELCRTRKHGIGGEITFPTLSDLQKILLDKPYYRLNVDGERIKLENVTHLYDQRLFQIAVLEQINIVLPTISTKEWKKLIQDLMDGREDIDPPAGSSKIDQLQYHLEEFCTNRFSTNATKEDITRGSVFQAEKKHYFIFSKFYHGFLVKKKWDEKPQHTHQMLKEHFKCAEDRILIGKKKVSVIVASSLERIEAPYIPKEFKAKVPY